MRISGIENLLVRSAMCLIGAIAVATTASTSSEAGTRKAVVAKSYAAATQAIAEQQQKSIKLRYFGGPKQMMYSE